MEIKKLTKIGKKGFAFTFLAFFISIIIVAFVYLGMGNNDYTKDSAFKESRISFIEQESIYFKEVYIKSVISYSLYNTLISLNNYSKDPLVYNRMSANYSYFNDLVAEGMYRGSFETNSQDFLLGVYDNKNKTLKYFISEFQNNFYDNYKANLTFVIEDINVYETIPYFVSVRIFATYNITTKDNLSTWNFEEYFTVSVPISDLYDPQFLHENNLNVKIKPAERYLSFENWTFNNFNKSISNNYTLVYYEPNYKYTIGDSYLKRLLGSNINSYDRVLGFWSFDYDEDEGGVYDSSNYSILGKHYGNTRLLMSFENSTILVNNIYDLSAYNNSGIKYNGVDCSVNGIYGKGCKFDGINEYINISKDKLNLNNTNKFSFNVWINPINYSSTTGISSRIFNYGNTNVDILSIGLNHTTKKVFFEVGSHVEGSYYKFISNSNISLNKWTNIIVVFDGESGVGKIYVNGFLDNIKDYNFETSSPLNNFAKSSKNPTIGNSLTFGYFNGTIDEVGVYSKVLTTEEVGDLFKEKKVKFIDYKDTLHGKGIEFDGITNSIELNISNNNFDDYTIEFWIKPLLESKDGNNIQLIYTLMNSSKSELRFFLNGGEKLEADVYFDDSGTIYEYGNLLSDFKVGDWNYYVFKFDGNSGSLYYNGILVDTIVEKGLSLNNINKTYFGSVYGIKYFYKGIIDEVKIYNRSLSDEEIRRNYYNYDSFSKGCCNYLTMINPNTMGYNKVFYDKKNVSYSSKMFYDYFNRSRVENLIVYNITNLTSNDVNKKYYNLQFDKCIADAYNIFDFENDTIRVDIVDTDATIGVNCGDLIKGGFY